MVTEQASQVAVSSYVGDLLASEAAKVASRAAGGFQNARRYPEPTESDIALIDVVFRKLKALVPAWKNALHSTGIEAEAKREWFKAFVDSGIDSQDQIDAGFARLRETKQTWWPTVAEFVSWCKTDVGGVPDAYRAYIEFCRASHDIAGATFSHPIVRLAGVSAGRHEMRSLPECEAFPIYERSYEVLLGRIKAGEELGAEVPKALPEHSAIPLSREESKARMLELMRSL